MQKHIEFFLELFPQLTKEEADLIENVINWTNEKKMAYKLAKSLFEESLKEKTDKELKEQEKLELFRKNFLELNKKPHEKLG